ncbi:MAG: hypothetical protein RBT65_18990 [Methanolobus sp.]|nr:hypothetical protein [Methanolobus sp.]
MGGGKSGGSGGYPSYQRGGSAEGDAYWDMYPDVEQAGMDPWYHYNQYGRNEGRQWGTPSNPLEDVMGMFTEMMGSMFEEEEPEPDWAVDAEGNFLLDEEGNRVEKSAVAYDDEGNIVYHPVSGDWLTPEGYTSMKQGLTRRDELYSDYLTAADLAIGYIDDQLLNEESQARLTGTVWKMDDATRTKRISDYFASIWGEGEQTELEGLMKEWGEPEGFAGFDVVRGEATPAGPEESSETLIGTSKGTRVKTYLDEEEEEAGSYLGG